MIAAAAVAMLGVAERHAAEQTGKAGPELERGFHVLRGALDALVT
jgi:hypothetical protein